MYNRYANERNSREGFSGENANKIHRVTLLVSSQSLKVYFEKVHFLNKSRKFSPVEESCYTTHCIPNSPTTEFLSEPKAHIHWEFCETLNLWKLLGACLPGNHLQRIPGRVDLKQHGTFTTHTGGTIYTYMYVVNSAIFVHCREVAQSGRFKHLLHGTNRKQYFGTSSDVLCGEVYYTVSLVCTYVYTICINVCMYVRMYACTSVHMY